MSLDDYDVYLTAADRERLKSMPLDHFRTKADIHAARTVIARRVVISAGSVVAIAVIASLVVGVLVALGHSDVPPRRVVSSLSMLTGMLTAVAAGLAVLPGVPERFFNRIDSCWELLEERKQTQELNILRSAVTAGRSILENHSQLKDLTFDRHAGRGATGLAEPVLLLDGAASIEAVVDEVRSIAARLRTLSDLKTDLAAQEYSPEKVEAQRQIAEQRAVIQKRVDALRQLSSQVVRLRKSVEQMQPETIATLDPKLAHQLGESAVESWKGRFSAERTAEFTERVSALNEGLVEVAGIAEGRIA